MKHAQWLIGLMMFLLIGGASIAPSTASAQMTAVSSEREQMLQRIEELTKLIAQLQQLLAERKKNDSISAGHGDMGDSFVRDVKSDVTLVLWEPDAGDEFNKEDPNDPISIEWRAQNVPPNTKIEIALDAVKVIGSGVSGGSWGQVLPVGDSNGAYDWVVHGEGRAMVGDYRLRAAIIGCHSDGCNKNHRFPGQEQIVSRYAVTDWVPLSIVRSTDIRVPAATSDGLKISRIRPNGGEYALNEEMEVTWRLDGLTGTESETCVSFYSREQERFFAPTSNESGYSCVPVEPGTNTLTWTPRVTSGFQFTPGEYRVNVRVLGEQVGYKDKATLAELTGNWFTVTD